MESEIYNLVVGPYGDPQNYENEINNAYSSMRK